MRGSKCARHGDLASLRATRFTPVKSRFVDRVPRGLRVCTFSGPDAKRGDGKLPPVECVNAVEPGAGRSWDISSLLSVRYRRQAHCPMRFLFPIFKICAITALGFPKGCERGRKRVGHGLWDSSCEAVAAPSLWRGVAATRLRTSMRAGAGRRGRVGEKSGSQPYWSRGQHIDKPRFWARKWIWTSFSPAWISFSLDLDFVQPGLEFLQPGLEFLQPGLEFVQPGLEFVPSGLLRTDPGADFRSRRERGDSVRDGSGPRGSSGLGVTSRREAPAVLRCVNAASLRAAPSSRGKRHSSFPGPGNRWSIRPLAQ